eukprot:scaffold47304_cov75-Phaeocystis_antarctica.AAC.4
MLGRGLVFVRRERDHVLGLSLLPLYLEALPLLPLLPRSLLLWGENTWCQCRRSIIVAAGRVQVYPRAGHASRRVPGLPALAR